MFIHGFKWLSISIPSGIFALLCLLPAASHGQDEVADAPPPTPSTIQTGVNTPPVAQTLIPEGVFAMQLAEALKLAPVSDEAEAEELLSSLGIEPRNGWLAEYPLTPAVLGDVEKGIALASDQGKIALTKVQALKLVSDVKARLGFDVNPGPDAPSGRIERPGNKTIYSYTDSEGVIHFTDEYDSIPEEYQKDLKTVTQSMLRKLFGGAGSGETQALEPEYRESLNPEDVNSYYYEQGPPVVTYYSPPDPYYYLYSWVPYPFWSTGFYFTGFFVLNNFHRQVFFNRHPYFVTHHAGGGDFSRLLSTGPVNPAWPGHAAPDAMTHSRWFSAPNAKASAGAIATLNQNRNRLINGTGTSVSRTGVSGPPFSPAGNSRPPGNNPGVLNSRTTIHYELFRPAPYFGGRIFNQPAFNQRTYLPNAPRFYSPPVFTQGPAFRAPGSFGGRVPGGLHGGGPSGEIQGGGNFTRHGGGGSFAGAPRGGRR